MSQRTIITCDGCGQQTEDFSRFTNHIHCDWSNRPKDWGKTLFTLGDLCDQCAESLEEELRYRIDAWQREMRSQRGTNLPATEVAS